MDKETRVAADPKLRAILTRWLLGGLAVLVAVIVIDWPLLYRLPTWAGMLIGGVFVVVGPTVVNTLAWRAVDRARDSS